MAIQTDAALVGLATAVATDVEMGDASAMADGENFVATANKKNDMAAITNKESYAANNKENQAVTASKENPPTPVNKGIMPATIPTDEMTEATTEVSEPAQSTMHPPSHPAVSLQPLTPQTSQEAAAAQQQILLEVPAVATQDNPGPVVSEVHQSPCFRSRSPSPFPIITSIKATE